MKILPVSKCATTQFVVLSTKTEPNLCQTDPSKQERDSKIDRMNFGGTFLEGSITKLLRLFRPLFLNKDLSTQYSALLLEIGGDEFENSSTLQKSETKLKQMYEDKISIEQGGTKRGRIVFNSEMRLEDALRKENDSKRRLEIQLRDAESRNLRKQSPQKLPENLKIADIFQGEVNVDQTRESNHLRINRDG